MIFARWPVLVAWSLVAVTTECREAFADSARVALVRPSVATPAVTEAMTRIRGELVSDGFDVIVLDSPQLESSSNAATSRDSGALATIELVVDATENAAELRVMDRLTNKTVTRRTTVDTPGTSTFAQVLAVRAVELLRASLLELLIQAHPVRAAPPPVVTAVTARASQWAARALDLEDESTWAVDAGTGVLAGFDGIGPALVAVLRVRRTIVHPFEMRATLAGLGTQPRIQEMQGSAGVMQEFGLVEVMASGWRTSVVHPVFSLGAGAMYVAVDGQEAVATYVGERGSIWAFAADAGAGFELRLSDRFLLSLEAHAFITRPYPTIRFVGLEVAHTSQPSLLGTLTIVAWL